MGLEASCTARLGRQSSAGQAKLEEKELVFRGAFRVKVPLADIRTVEAKGGALRVGWPGGELRLELGPAAVKWADKIRNPRGLLEKLGVTPDSRVAVLGLDDPAFLAQLRARTPHVATRAGKGLDLVLVAMSKPADLVRLPALRRAIAPDGAVWVLWPKGVKTFREDDVRAAGPSAGLVDVKVVSFSDVRSGLKLVVPRALRG